VVNVTPRIAADDAMHKSQIITAQPAEQRRLLR